MKIQGNEIKPGMIIELNNDHWTVLKAQHVKPGKGGAFNQVELKSLTKGTKLNQRFRSSENVERAMLEEKEFNFLYSDEKQSFFMDPVDFEQISLKNELMEEEFISLEFEQLPWYVELEGKKNEWSLRFVFESQDQTRSFEMYWPIPIAQNLFYEIKNMWESMD